MDSSLVPTLLASISFDSVTLLIVTSGLALIGIAFAGFVISKASDAAAGRTTEDEAEDEDERN